MIQEPPIVQKDPQAYYSWLRAQGMPGQQAYQLTEQRFGTPKSPQDAQADAARAQQNAALAQTGGYVGGSIIASQAPGWFGAGAGAGATGTTAAAGGAAGAGTAGAVGAGATGAGAASATGAGAGATAGGAAAEGSMLGSVGSIALPIAAVAAAASNAWETGMKDILRGRGDRADWLNQGANVLTGAIPNTALRLMGKPSIGKMMTSGKSNAQSLRDDFRGVLKTTGVADNKYMVTLADGSKFNIGLDGKTKYQNLDGSKRNAWDVDWSNPLAKAASEKIDPMIKNIYGEEAQKRGIRPEQYTGMLVNAVTSNAQDVNQVMANIESMFGNSTFAKQAGVQTPVQANPVTRPAKGQVARVSPGMYMNDRGEVRPAKTVREALRANYEVTKRKGK